mgnify:CR=1 FL=1
MSGTVDFREEIIDWGIVAVAGAGAYVFSTTGPFCEQSFIDGRTNLPLMDENLPRMEFYGTTFAISAIALLMPALELDKSMKYNHFKGLIQSATTTAMLTGLTKDIFGAPRPDADARRLAEYDERHIRDSFPSGHASFAFACATYSSLYIMRFAQDDNWRHSSLKIVGAAGFFAGASAVAYSRVDRNKHRPEDVIAGALLGAGVATGFFFWKDNCTTASPMPEIEIAPDGISLVWKF